MGGRAFGIKSFLDQLHTMSEAVYSPRRSTMSVAEGVWHRAAVARSRPYDPYQCGVWKSPCGLMQVWTFDVDESYAVLSLMDSAKAVCRSRSCIKGADAAKPAGKRGRCPAFGDGLSPCRAEALAQWPDDASSFPELCRVGMAHVPAARIVNGHRNWIEKPFLELYWAVKNLTSG